MTDTLAGDTVEHMTTDGTVEKHSCPDCGVLHGTKSLIPAMRRVKIGIEKICPDCGGPGHSSLGTDANKFRCLLRQYAKDKGKAMTGKEFQEVTEDVFSGPSGLTDVYDFWFKNQHIKLAETETVTRPYEVTVEVDTKGKVSTKNRKSKKAETLTEATALGDQMPDVLPDIPILIEGDTANIEATLEEAQEFNGAEDKAVTREIADTLGQEYADTVNTTTLEMVDSNKLVTVVAKEAGVDKEAARKAMQALRRKNK